MTRTFSPAWIRVAGHSHNIKNSAGPHWRCYINQVLPMIWLATWRLTGIADASNVVPGSLKTGDALGLSAWIDFYGELSVDENEKAVIALLTPPSRPS